MKAAILTLIAKKTDSAKIAAVEELRHGEEAVRAVTTWLEPLIVTSDLVFDTKANAIYQKYQQALQHIEIARTLCSESPSVHSYISYSRASEHAQAAISLAPQVAAEQKHHLAVLKSFDPF